MKRRSFVIGLAAAGWLPAAPSFAQADPLASWNDGPVKQAILACCVPQNPRGGTIEASYDPRQPAIRIPRKVLKGGSHLCAPNYCRRYRPAARHAEPVDTSTSHVGFRCIVRATR